MATIKWQQKALSLSHQNDEWWVYIPYEAHGDYCTGKFSVIRDEIAYRLTCEHLFPSVPRFQLHSLEGDIVEYESIEYKPHLDTRDMNHWN